jgi:hypothetical protein
MSRLANLWEETAVAAPRTDPLETLSSSDGWIAWAATIKTSAIQFVGS